jgi:hypothetical protein
VSANSKAVTMAPNNENKEPSFSKGDLFGVASISGVSAGVLIGNIFNTTYYELNYLTNIYFYMMLSVFIKTKSLNLQCCYIFLVLRDHWFEHL